MGSLGQMLFWSCFCYTSSFALNYFSWKVLAWVYLLFEKDATLNPNRNECCTFFSSWIMNVLGFAEKIRSAAQSFTLRFGELFAKPHIKCTNCDCDIDISNVSSVNYLVISLWPLYVFFALSFDWPSLNFENVILDIISIKHSDPAQVGKLCRSFSLNLMSCL